MLQELDGLPVVKPLGGWSMLMDVVIVGADGRCGVSAVAGARQGRRDGDDGLGEPAQRPVRPVCVL